MRKYGLLILLMMCPIVLAQDYNYDIPAIWGGLGWSPDGQYLAVATTRGVYIHRSDDLSIIEVLDTDLSVHTVDWSHSGYQLAYDDRDNAAIAIHDFETGDRSMFNVIDEETSRITSIQWSPDDTLLAIGISLTPDSWIILIDVVEGNIVTTVFVKDYVGSAGSIRVNWSPDGQYLFAGKSDDNALIWDVVQQQPAYIWEFNPLPADEEVIYGYDAITHTDAMKWDHTGTQIAGGWHERMYVADVMTGEILHLFTRRNYRFYGLSWHPVQDKLTFIAHEWTEDEMTPDTIVIIWDFATDEVIELFEVVFTTDNNNTQNIITWSPDGGKLASMSSDGRIIIWETENYEVIAEYDGYRNLYSDNDE